MGSRKIPFDKVVTGRVTTETKFLMDHYGFSVRDAVNGYLKQIEIPSKSLKLKIQLKKEEIKDLKIDLIAAEMDLEELEKKLQEITKKSDNNG